MSKSYESITEKAARSLVAVGGIRGCSLLTLPDAAGYVLSFAVAGVAGGAMVLRSHRDPVRIFKNPAAAFRLVESMGLDSLTVPLSPVALSRLPGAVRQLGNQRTMDFRDGEANQLVSQRSPDPAELPRHERRRLDKAKRKKR